MGRDIKVVHLPRESLAAIRNSAHSCVVVNKSSYHLTLHPHHTNDINYSIKEILSSGVSRYDKEFGAIVLGYENVAICGSYAPMTDDTPYMHTQIEADFYLFKPAVGEKLEGIVNKKNDHHLGCLVHQLFNVSLPKPTGVEVWSGHNVEIGQRIQFRVTFTHLDARLPYIRGELIDEEVPVTSPKIPKKKKKSKKPELEDAQVHDMIAELKAPKKAKKRKKAKSPSLLHDTLSDLNLEEIFAESDPKLPVSSNSISHSNLEIIDDIILPPDSEMDEILKDVELPKSCKKRKHDKETRKSVKKKKRSKSENS